MLSLFLSQLATALPGLPSTFLQSLLRCRNFSPAEGEEEAELTLSHRGCSACPAAQINPRLSSSTLCAELPLLVSLIPPCQALLSAE